VPSEECALSMNAANPAEAAVKTEIPSPGSADRERRGQRRSWTACDETAVPRLWREPPSPRGEVRTYDSETQAGHALLGARTAHIESLRKAYSVHRVWLL